MTTYARFGKNDRGEDGGSLHYRDKESVWDIKREYWRGAEKTPTKLPAEIVAKMLAYSSVEGDLVLDPFRGSGQVAVVARRMGRGYMGFEVSKRYCEFARRRLADGGGGGGRDGAGARRAAHAYVGRGAGEHS